MVAALQVKVTNCADEIQRRIRKRLDHRNYALPSFQFKGHKGNDRDDGNVISPAQRFIGQDES